MSQAVLVCIELHFLGMLTVTESIIVNAALNKVATYCDKTEIPKVVDGDTSHERFERISDFCGRDAYVIINLRDEYNIKYVRVFYGNDALAANLNYFLIEMIANKTITARCGEYPFILPFEPVAMRVNCIPSANLYSMVQLKSEFDRGLSIAEIEIYGHEASATENLFIYRGCFKNFGTSTENLDLIGCRKQCLLHKFIFAGVKANEYCSCDDNVGGELPVESCYFKCDDGVHYCGGVDGYSVYLVNVPQPHYLGCYENSDEFINDAKLSEEMTVQRCILRCDDYQFAKLQDGDYCICDNVEPVASSKMSSRNCNLKCTADERFTCGGTTHAAIYATCKLLSRLNFISCSQLYVCNRSSYNEYGECSDCKEGWLGDQCLEQKRIDVDPPPTTPNGTDGSDLFRIISKLRNNSVLLFLLLGILIFILGATLLCKRFTRRDTESSDHSRKQSAVPAPPKK